MLKPIGALVFLGVLLGSTFAGVLHARLVDESHRPIVGAIVAAEVLLPAKPGTYARGEHFECTTGANGGFDVDLHDETVPFLALAQLPNGHFIPFRVNEENQEVVLADKVVGLVATFVDQDGFPLANQDVTLSLSEGMRQLGNAAQLPSIPRKMPTFRTSEHGTLTITGLPPHWAVSFSTKSEDFTFPWEPTTLSGDSDIAATIHVVHTGQIRGRVTRNGKPVAKVYVGSTTFLPKEDFDHNERWNSYTDADGNYVIKRVHPGNVLVRPVSDYYGTRSPKNWIGPSGGPHFLAAGEHMEHVDFDLGTLMPTRVHVRLQKSGKPLPGALMRVANELDDASFYSLTDNKGEFESLLAPGQYRVSFHELGRRRLKVPVVRWVTVNPSKPAMLDLQVPDDIQFPTLPGVSGVVVDADNRPVAQATVEAVGQYVKATTDLQGRFSIINPIEPGTLLFASKGDQITKHYFTLRTESEVKIRMDGKEATLMGCVTDDQGTPLPNIHFRAIALRAQGPVDLEYFQADNTGKFKLSHILADDSRVTLLPRSDDFDQAPRGPFSVSSGETKELPAIQLHRCDGVVSGQVLNADGSPAVGICVIAGIAPARRCVATTDKQGRFTLTRVPRGEVTLNASRTTLLLATLKCHSGDLNVKIRLPKPSH